eukprot:149095_1
MGNTLGPEWIPMCYTSPAVYAVVFFTILVLLSVFNIIFSFYGLYKMYHANKKLPIDTTIKILYIIINVLFGFGGIAYALHLIVGFDCGEWDLWAGFGLTGFNCYSYGLALLYLLYLMRLWMVFHAGLVNKLSIVAFIIGIIGFVLQFVLPPFATYYFHELNWDMAIMFMNFFTFINAGFSLYILYLFCSKVRSLGQIQQMDTKIILGPAIRYSFCVFVSVTSSEFVNIVNVYRAYVEDTDFWWSLHLTLIVMDESINLICLFFQFNFGKKYYFKFFSKMHSFIESKVIRKMSVTETDKRNIDKIPETQTKTVTTNSVVSSDIVSSEMTITESPTQNTKDKDGTVTSTDIVSNSL